MNELALFAGAGGGLLGSTLLGWRTSLRHLAALTRRGQSGCWGGLSDGQTYRHWQWTGSKSGSNSMGDAEYAYGLLVQAFSQVLGGFVVVCHEFLQVCVPYGSGEGEDIQL